MKPEAQNLKPETREETDVCLMSCFLSLIFFFLPFAMVVMAGCGASQEQKPPPAIIDNEPPSEMPPGEKVAASPDSWIFERRAILLRVQSVAALNRYQDRAHTLLLGIYQLSDPNGFNTMRASKEGLQELLGKERFDASGGILAAEKRVIRPDRAEVIILDRAEAAQYVGIVAGYFDLIPERVSYLIRIPAVQDDKTGLAQINPLADPPSPRPGRLRIWLELDRDRIESIRTDAD